MLTTREHRARLFSRDLADAQAARDVEAQRLAAEAAERDRVRREQIQTIVADGEAREKRLAELAARPYAIRVR